MPLHRILKLDSISQTSDNRHHEMASSLIVRTRSDHQSAAVFEMYYAINLRTIRRKSSYSTSGSSTSRIPRSGNSTRPDRMLRNDVERDKYSGCWMPLLDARFFISVAPNEVTSPKWPECDQDRKMMVGALTG